MRYFYGCMYRDEITEYSPVFESFYESLKWYEEKGVYLEQMFNRVLIPSQKIVVI